VTSLQDKFFRVLNERAEARGLEVAVAKSFSNVGDIHLQAPGSFETALTVHFNAQPGGIAFGEMVPRDASPEIWTMRPNPRYARFRADELDLAIDTILAAASPA
jgi:hypothetical protein